MAELFNWSPTDASNVDLWPEGMVGGTINNSGRAMQGLLARDYADRDGSRLASGSSNAFAVTPARTISGLLDSLRQTFRANHTITGPATLNLGSLGVKSIKRWNGSELAAGDIVSGQIVDVAYVSALDVWLMMSAPTALVTNMFGDFSENTPAAPAADVARLFARDIGDGVTELVWFDSASFTTSLRRAVQSEMEAAALVTRLVTPGVQHFHPGHPKAWANFNGAGAPLTLDADYGVSSVDDNGTGSYTVNFDTAFADDDYAPIGSTANNSSNTSVRVDTASLPQTTSCDLFSGNPSQGNASDRRVYAVFLGDH